MRTHWWTFCRRCHLPSPHLSTQEYDCHLSPRSAVQVPWCLEDIATLACRVTNGARPDLDRSDREPPQRRQCHTAGHCLDRSDREPPQRRQCPAVCASGTAVHPRCCDTVLHLPPV